MLPKKQDETKDMPPWLARAITAYDKDGRADGDLLTHQWIKWALDIPEPSTLDQATELQWVLLTRLDAFRDYMLMKRKIALQNVRGEGYRIVPPAEQARFAAEQAMELVKRGLDKGEKIITNTRTNELSTDEQKQHTDAHIRLCGIKSMMTRQRRDVFRLFSPST
jgi:hypothetical protein